MNAPGGWPQFRLKYTVLSIRNGMWGDEPAGDATDVRCIRAADFDRTHLRAVPESAPCRHLTALQLGQNALKRGDLVLEKSGGGDTQPVGLVVLFDDAETAVCSNFAARIRVRQGFDSRYLCYLHAHLYATGINTKSIKQNTGIQNLDAGSYFDERVGVAPDAEQRVIADFLDRETDKIDALVAKKQRLIELLQEKRDALISHAVTKGLDPDVPMKGSGVEWLSQVPEAWDVAPVYSRYEVQLGKMLDSSRITGDSLRPYVRNVDVQWDCVNAEDLPLMDFDAGDRARYALKIGDLLVCEGGEVGKAAVWTADTECYYQKALHRLRPRRAGESPRFMFYVMRMAAKRGVFVASSNQNTIDHLTAEKLRRHRFAFPEPEEQLRIVEYLDAEAVRLDLFSGRVHEALARLKEYRSALITAAVTGQIDVRTYRQEAS